MKNTCRGMTDEFHSHLFFRCSLYSELLLAALPMELSSFCPFPSNLYPGPFRILTRDISILATATSINLRSNEAHPIFLKTFTVFVQEVLATAEGQVMLRLDKYFSSQPFAMTFVMSGTSSIDMNKTLSLFQRSLSNV